MTRRTHSATKGNSTTAPSTSSGTPRADVLEERLLAFAEHLGRIAGTVQAKTAGWMDGDALKKELARVRDGAADLLQQLTADAPPVAVSRPTGGPAPRRSRSTSATHAGRTSGRGEQINWGGSAQTKPSTQWRHRRRAREDTSSAHADRSRRQPCGQSGGQNARGKDDGQDTPAPRARLEFHSS